MAPKENSKASSEFVISRTFNAPRDIIFDMWTDPKHLVNWMGPTGSKSHYKTADIRPGGMSHYYMEIPGGKLWGKVNYKEIQKPSRLVYVQSFSDENGGLGTHPMAPIFPPEMLTTVIFEASGNKTNLTLTWIAVNATDEEIATFEGMKPGMTQGWGGSFERLDEYLANQK